MTLDALPVPAKASALLTATTKGFDARLLSARSRATGRVVVPFTISCGECFFCRQGFYSGCERSNPDKQKAEKMWGHSPAGLFGYSHILGGFPGGQAEYLRVPYADVGPIKVPDGLSDEQIVPF